MGTRHWKTLNAKNDCKELREAFEKLGVRFEIDADNYGGVSSAILTKGAHEVRFTQGFSVHVRVRPTKKKHSLRYVILGKEVTELFNEKWDADQRALALEESIDFTVSGSEAPKVAEVEVEVE